MNDVALVFIPPRVEIRDPILALLVRGESTSATFLTGSGGRRQP